MNGAGVGFYFKIPLSKHLHVFVSFVILINVCALQILLDVEDLKSQEASDSDSDSGQGSCEMTSPAQINKGVASVDDEGQ